MMLSFPDCIFRYSEHLYLYSCWIQMFILPSIISLTSLSETPSLLAIIFLNVTSSINPVFSGSRDLKKREWEGKSYVLTFWKTSVKDCSSGSALLCTETRVRYSLKDRELPDLSADTSLAKERVCSSVVRRPRHRNTLWLSFRLRIPSLSKSNNWNNEKNYI